MPPKCCLWFCFKCKNTQCLKIQKSYIFFIIWNINWWNDISSIMLHYMHCSMYHHHAKTARWHTKIMRRLHNGICCQPVAPQRTCIARHRMLWAFQITTLMQLITKCCVKMKSYFDTMGACLQLQWKPSCTHETDSTFRCHFNGVILKTIY